MRRPGGAFLIPIITKPCGGCDVLQLGGEREGLTSAHHRLAIPSGIGGRSKGALSRPDSNCWKAGKSIFDIDNYKTLRQRSIAGGGREGRAIFHPSPAYNNQRTRR